MSPQLSAEVRAIVGYIQASGVPHRIASTYRVTATRHGWPGTDGWGLAVDIAGARPGIDTPELKAIYDAYWLVRGQARELYYSGPGVTHNVRKGLITKLSDIPLSIQQAHHDHIHISVVKGTFIKWPGSIPTTPEEAVRMNFLSAIDSLTGGIWFCDQKDGAIYAFDKFGQPTGRYLGGGNTGKVKIVGTIVGFAEWLGDENDTRGNGYQIVSREPNGIWHFYQFPGNRSFA